MVTYGGTACRRVTDPLAVKSILAHLGEPTIAPEVARARGPRCGTRPPSRWPTAITPRRPCPSSSSTSARAGSLSDRGARAEPARNPGREQRAGVSQRSRIDRGELGLATLAELLEQRRRLDLVPRSSPWRRSLRCRTPRHPITRGRLILRSGLAITEAGYSINSTLDASPGLADARSGMARSSVAMRPS